MIRVLGQAPRTITSVAHAISRRSYEWIMGTSRLFAALSLLLHVARPAHGV